MDDHDRRWSTHDAAQPAGLTPPVDREHRSKELATRLAVSVGTMRAYLKPVRANLGAKARTAIVSIVHCLHPEGIRLGD